MAETPPSDTFEAHQQPRHAINVVPRDAERAQAFDLFLAAEAAGKRRSLRSISQELGVHEQTVRRWMKTDAWQSKVDAALIESSKVTVARVNSLKQAVRDGLATGLNELHLILKRPGSKAREKVEAVRALADIAVKLGAIAEATGDEGAAKGSRNFDFKDDIKEPEWLPATSVPPLESTEPLPPEDSPLLQEEPVIPEGLSPEEEAEARLEALEAEGTSPQ